MTRIAMVLFPNLTQLDLAGPYEVLSRLPGTEIDLAAHTLEPIKTDRGMALLPSVTFAKCPQPDILFVPGGPGVNAMLEDPEVIGFLQRTAPAARLITSVCTGSLVLAAAGLLRGKRATSHWMVVELLEAFGAIPVRERVVHDGNVWTGAGVSAGIDFALRLAADLHGETLAQRIQLQIEYDPEPPFDSGSPDRADPAVVAEMRELGRRLTEERREIAARIGKAAAR